MKDKTNRLHIPEFMRGKENKHLDEDSATDVLGFEELIQHL